MTSTTPKGYPYPDGTDQVADGDNAIQALAEAVDTNLGVAAGGSVSIDCKSAGTNYSAAVTFPAGRFTATPIGMAGINISAPNSAECSLAYLSNTGATVRAMRPSSTGSVACSWIAIQF